MINQVKDPVHSSVKRKKKWAPWSQKNRTLFLQGKFCTFKRPLMLYIPSDQKVSKIITPDNKIHFLFPFFLTSCPLFLYSWGVGGRKATSIRLWSLCQRGGLSLLTLDLSISELLLHEQASLQSVHICNGFENLSFSWTGVNVYLKQHFISYVRWISYL